MSTLLQLISQPWPWFVSGAVIALIMAALLFSGRTFGFSSNLRTICALCGAGKVSDFFSFNWRDQLWNLLFLIGAILGGFISSVWLRSPEPIALSPATVNDLHQLGIQFDGELQPAQLFALDALTVPKALLLLAGGLLVGFGTRYAGGCTSGHAISGLSALQLPSLIAVIGFFIGGLLMTHLIFPLIF